MVPGGKIEFLAVYTPTDIFLSPCTENSKKEIELDIITKIREIDSLLRLPPFITALKTTER